MHKEMINDKEGICLITLFVAGSTLITGIGVDTGNDAWIAGIVGILMSLPVIFVYSRILSLFHGRNLYDILEITMGKIAGKIVTVLYIWYSMHLSALVMRNFSEFINTVTMPETPMLVPIMFLAVCCIINVRNGIEVMGRSAAYFLPIVVIIIVVVQLLAIPQLDLSNVKPVLGKGIAPVIKGGFAALSFPFAETVLLTGSFFTLQTRKSIYKVFFSGILFAGTIIVVLVTRNIMVLGDMRESFYFPSHLAVSRISVGSFLQRIEVTVVFVFVVGVFYKASLCLYAACIGLGRLFGLHDYRSIVIQTGFLTAFLCYIVYDNIMEMSEFAFKIYPYYAFPYQVILPLIVWILAEIKAKKLKSQKSGQSVK